MSDSGTTLRLPNGVFTLIEPAEATGGERVSFEITLPPGAKGPPSHFHPSQHESWRMIEGELALTVDDQEQTLRSGEEVTIPPGAVHTFANRAQTPARFHDLHTPALDFQQYIETLARLTASGKLAGHTTPSGLIYGAMVLHRHRTTQLSASRMQRAAETLLAALGRALRHTID